MVTCKNPLFIAKSSLYWVFHRFFSTGLKFSTGEPPKTTVFHRLFSWYYSLIPCFALLLCIYAATMVRWHKKLWCADTNFQKTMVRWLKFPKKLWCAGTNFCLNYGALTQISRKTMVRWHKNYGALTQVFPLLWCADTRNYGALTQETMVRWHKFFARLWL